MFICGMRTIFLCTTKTLATFQLGQDQKQKQQNTDKTACHHIAAINVIISILNDDMNLKAICHFRFIIFEDGTAEKQSQEIVVSFKELGVLIWDWGDVT